MNIFMFTEASSAGVIAGSVIGAVVLIVVIVLLLYFLWYRRRGDGNTCKLPWQPFSCFFHITALNSNTAEQFLVMEEETDIRI